MTPKKIGMIAVGAVVLIGAFFVFRAKTTDNRLPSSGFETTWICESCGQQFKLSPAEVDSWNRTRLRKVTGFTVKPEVFKCTKCNKFSIVGAEIDPGSGKWYPLYDSNQKPLPTPDWVKGPPGD